MSNTELLDTITEEILYADGHDADVSPPRKRIRMSYDCDVCATSFTERRSLVRHLQTRSHCEKVGQQSLQFPCSYCTNYFTRDDIRQRHERESHFHVKRSATTGSNVTIEIPPTFSTSSLDSSVDTENSYVQPATTGRAQLYVAEDYQELMYLGQIIDIGPNNEEHSSQSHKGPYSALQPHKATEFWNRSSPGILLDLNCNDPLDETTMKLAPASISPETCEVVEPSLLDKGMKGDEHASIVSISSLNSFKQRVELPTSVLRSRFSLLRHGASQRFTSKKSDMQCLLCKQPFGRTKSEVRLHLEQHVDEFNATHMCRECEVGFVREEDIQMHRNSAMRGHCGFDFDHARPCTGHHPPVDLHTGLSDHDRLNLSNRLHHWEQAQLQAFISQVSDLLSDNYIPPDAECWSIHGFLSSVESLCSLLSNLTFRSTPGHFDRLTRRDFRKERGPKIKPVKPQERVVVRDYGLILARSFH